MSDYSELYNAILTGNAKKAEEVTKAAIAAKADPSELVQKYMIPAMDEVGKRFECNEYFVPELLIAARAMKTSLELITPLLAAAGTEPVGHVVIGTVQGDLHDIGKNLVASMLEGGGFKVTDLGVDVPRRTLRRSRQGTRRHDHRAVGPADHDHDDDEDRHPGVGEGRHPQQDQGHDRRRADHPAIRRRDRRRRLQRQRQHGRGAGPQTGVTRHSYRLSLIERSEQNVASCERFAAAAC